MVNYNILSFGEQDIESILCLTLATGISYLCPRLLDKKRLLPPCLTRNGLAYMLFLLCNGMMFKRVSRAVHSSLPDYTFVLWANLLLKSCISIGGEPTQADGIGWNIFSSEVRRLYVMCFPLVTLNI